MKFKWTKIEQDAFEEMNQILARNTLLPYPCYINNLKFIPMLAISNWGRFLARKENQLLSMVEK